MRQELIKKCSTYVEKKALQSLVSKISGIAGIVGGILFPDSLNEGEDEMIKQLYCNKCENKI
ncbi:hypothetical protein ASZ90_006859 [hydrocarbon metagenome]|uniref:Uncharacterized protein n=1 Tax=hydrocarbon metagenome TaxID=938273 RepID=A0A0W8FR88_9ZZZZ